MASSTVDLDDDSADADPFDFCDAGSSEVLRGSTVDERLVEHRFGER